MIATWATGQAAPTLRGKHKAGTPRIWTVTMHLQSGDAKGRVVIRTKQPVPLRQLQDGVITPAMDEFEAENGRLTHARWEAVAR